MGEFGVVFIAVTLALCRREGKTFISVDPEHLQILL